MTDATKQANPVTPEIQRAFSAQQQAFARNPMPSQAERSQHLKQLRNLLLKNRDKISASVDRDFGGRSPDETLIAEITPCLLHIDYTLSHLRKWMKPKRRNPGMLLQPASARVVYQPLGVVGIIAPFNYPVYLTFMPLIAAIAAGNSVMLKLSENTPHTANLLYELIRETFSPDHITVIRGGVEAGVMFSQLPFDHLLFTGSTAIGKKIMRAAADNLTPVTLELGGKSPAIIADDVSLQLAAERLCFAKSLTAGQTCIAPDYVLLPRHKMNEFISQFCATFLAMYPEPENNPDYTVIINESAYLRLHEWLQDAREKGASITATGTCDNRKRRMPIHLVSGVTEEMHIMQHELFGPILPILPYDTIDEAIQYVNSHPRPLGLYLFTHEKSLQDRVIQQTHAGTMCINEALLQIAVDDMPFGGSGPSGLGQYHGHEGFLTFSKAKSILHKGRINSTSLLYPPYGGWVQKLLTKWLLR